MDRTETVIVDVDGTVALRRGRGPYDEKRLGEDLPNEPVIRCVRALAQAGMHVVFVTGRRERTRLQTAIWLRAHVVGDFDLHMRADDDDAPDADVKARMLPAIEHSHRIAMVFDDRDAVVAMWRARGMTCFQVAPGNF